MLLKIALVALAGLTVACSSTSVEHEDAGTECRGPGRYEAGKEGSYLPCCAGLTEVEYESAGYSETGPICWSPPLRVYACVQGTCGDGIC
jgi:hypothetical protein